jgi:hypothetical protein
VVETVEKSNPGTFPPFPPGLENPAKDAGFPTFPQGNSGWFNYFNPKSTSKTQKPNPSKFERFATFLRRTDFCPIEKKD